MRTDFFDELGDMLTKTAKELGDKAEQFYGTQKVRSRIMAEERVIEKMTADMGWIVYKRHEKGEALDNELSILCQEIDQHVRRLKEFKSEEAGIRGQKICPSCEKSVDKSVSFCPYCGAPCPDPEPEMEEDTVLNPEEADAEPSEEAQREETAEAGETAATEETQEKDSCGSECAEECTNQAAQEPDMGEIEGEKE